jgi:hypothetical protein
MSVIKYHNDTSHSFEMSDLNIGLGLKVQVPTITVRKELKAGKLCMNCASRLHRILFLPGNPP